MEKSNLNYHFFTRTLINIDRIFDCHKGLRIYRDPNPTLTVCERVIKEDISSIRYNIRLAGECDIL